MRLPQGTAAFREPRAISNAAIALAREFLRAQMIGRRGRFGSPIHLEGTARGGGKVELGSI